MSTTYNRRRGARSDAPRKARQCLAKGCIRFVGDGTSQVCDEHRNRIIERRNALPPVGTLVAQ